MSAITMIEPEEVADAVKPSVTAPLPAMRSNDAVAPVDRKPSVVEYAIQSGASVSEVRALVELQIQMDNHKLAMRQQDDIRERELRAEAARNAYNEAMAAFKAAGIKVIRSKAITDGPLKGKKHADLFAVTDAATEVMSQHGLSASWKPVDDGRDWIRLACIVKHVAGHSESVEFGGPIDTGPGRNAIQARKSTVTYLERVTLLLALGLAEADADDDGGGGRGDGKVTDAAAQSLIEAGRAKSLEGMKSLTSWWGALTARQRNELSKDYPGLRRAAERADQEGRHHG